MSLSGSDDEENEKEGEEDSFMGNFLFGNIDPKTGALENEYLESSEIRGFHKTGVDSFLLQNIVSKDEMASKEPGKKKKKIRHAYDDEDSDSDDDDDDESSKVSKESDDSKEKLYDNSEDSSTSLGDEDDDDYDNNEKLPIAIDFFNESEMAEEEAIIQTFKPPTGDKDDTDYDEDDSKEEEKGVTEKDDKLLMPPPKIPAERPTSIKISTENETTTQSSSQNNQSASDSSKKLETPLAAMLPSKYQNTDVTELFPDFRPEKVLRFSRLFGPGKVSSLPQVWRNVKKRRKKRKAAEIAALNGPSATITGTSANSIEKPAEVEEKVREKVGWNNFDDFEVPEDQCVEDQTKTFLLPLEPFKNEGNEKDKKLKEAGDGRTHKSNIWRTGPAQLWYDMLNVPEDDEVQFDYGFKLKNTKTKSESDFESSDDENRSDEETKPAFPDDAFHMVTQLRWEDNVIWDPTEYKHKMKLPNKNKAAGWVPSSQNRTAQFSQQHSSVSSNIGGGVISKAGTSGSGGGGSSQGKKGSKIEDSNPNIDDTCYSIFPVETSELVYGRWEDDVIWDAEDMKSIPEPRILALDPNDENIVLCVPDDIDPNESKSNMPPVKVKIPHPHVKKSKILLGKAGVINVIEEDSPPPSPKNDDKDPYNISNDEYYQPKYTEQSMLKISASGNIIQHSTPVVELRTPFIPTHMGETKLKNFHRPSLKKFSHGLLSSTGPHLVLPLTKHVKKKAKQREQERLAAGGGDIFFMRNPEDLSGKDGELILVEYMEEHPPLLCQVGMCSKFKNYYKRKAGKDTGPPDAKYGDTTYAHTSPFLGAMHPGQMIQTVENNMYRAPVYEHPYQLSDFLIIRTRMNYFIREYDSIFTAGQECPLYEVPGPNSKRANNFVRDFLQVFIYRLFWRSRDNPRRIRMDDIKKAFPMHSESSIRKRLKLCADFKRTGADSNWWVIKPEFRLPTEEEIRAMVSPEQCCAYFSLTAAEQRLKDAGYGEKFLLAPQDDDDEENQGKIDDEVKTAPWNTTRAYIQAMKGKCLLQLTGPADPTGSGEGFSYIRVPNKPQTSKEEQESQPKRIVTGTDADLRRLSLNNAKALLRKFGVPEDEIKKLSRWEVIDVVRTLSTEKAKAGEMGMTKFSRGNRFSVAEHQERYKEECQRIFELQNKVLASSETLSTDEGESSEEELSDIEEMGKNIENMLSNKKTSSQLNHEKEEQERRELQKMIMGETDDKNSDDKDKSKDKKKKGGKDDDDNNSLSGLMNHPGRVLKIHRKFKGPDGREFTRTETVRKSTIIDIYMRIRTTKDENWIRQFAFLDDNTKEEMKKEKRRIQEQLRRIKRNQEKESAKEKHHHVHTPKPKKVKLKPELKMKCGACGQVGHMRTNKACPLYQSSNSPLPSMNVAMTEEQEEEIEKQLLIDDDSELVKLDGTKVKLSGQLIKQAEEIKRRSLLLKVPKEAVATPKARKKRAHPDQHCDYLYKKGKSNRRRVDPIVVISGIFEDILNEMRDLPDTSPFHKPVHAKQVPRYYEVIKNPMDLQTMREKIRNKQYQTRGEFLNDSFLMVTNSSNFNGPHVFLTVVAQRMYDLAHERVREKEEKLDKLEKRINPLLDDDQTGLSHILLSLIDKVKLNSDSIPFYKPVDKKKVPAYYNKITNPMDLYQIEKKVEAHKYSNRQEFLEDFKLIASNSIKFNGPESTYSQKAQNIVNILCDYFITVDEALTTLEFNIAQSKQEEDGEEFVEMDEESRGDLMEMDELIDTTTRDSIGFVEEEIGEYLSEDEEPLRKKVRLEENADADAIEAMMQLSSGFTKKRSQQFLMDSEIASSSSKVRNDLEVSDSEEEGEVRRDSTSSMRETEEFHY